MTEKRKAVWNAELELFREFRAICERHNLRYFADGGTLLGAVRHKGFIPWDDDLDVSMLREDYDKFIKAAKEELPSDCFLQIPETEEDYFYGHAKIRKNNTTAIRYIQYPEQYTHHQGVFIDIFPIDNVPDGKIARSLHRFVTRKVMQIIYYAKYYYRLNKHALVTKIKHRICKMLLPTNKAIKRAFRLYEKWYRLPNKSTTKQVAISALYYEDKYIWQREWFQETLDLPFEDIMIKCPKEYDSLLKHIFGDYMTPVQTASFHGEVFFDLEHNYSEYFDGTRSFSEEDLKL